MSAMNKSRRKILFVVPYNPLLGSKGPQGPKNVSQPLIGLLSAEHDIVLVVVADDPALSEAQLRSAFPLVRNIHICQAFAGRARQWARLRYMLSCLPPSLADGASPELVKLLREYVPASDLVHFEYFTLAPSIRLVQPLRPVQLHCHDAYSLYQLRYLGQAHGVVEKAKALLRFLMFKHLEHGTIAKAAAALTVSPVDRQYLADAGLTNVHYLPPAVQDIDFPIAPDRAGMPAELLCVVPATYHHFQAAALRDFFRDAFPALNSRGPGKVSVTLFGKSARRFQAELAPYVQAHAVEFVDDYFTFLGSKNWIYFYPQRAGAGLHTKIRDAMAVELPVVGYAEIMDAFEGKSGEHYFSCTDDNRVIEVLSSLLADPELHSRIGEAGKRFLSEQFGPANVLGTLERVFMKIEKYGN
jgi:glycosyltransferase involved in cell wall biosynthesis